MKVEIERMSWQHDKDHKKVYVQVRVESKSQHVM